VSFRAAVAAAALVAVLAHLDPSKLQEPHAWKR
jgi:hypothetical protein